MEDLSIDHTLASSEEIIPKINMEFDSEDAAYNFYNEYARVTGFSIRRHTVHKDINDCGAMMKINGRYGSKYKVVHFVSEHKGHDLVSPSKAYMLKSHRRMTEVQASQVDDLDCSGITPRVSFALMSKQVGGRENIGFIFEDYKNHLHSKRTTQMKCGDTAGYTYKRGN
ncbi:hypothetical protein ACS0TY_013459 [Phlomoides rotata]